MGARLGPGGIPVCKAVVRQPPSEIHVGTVIPGLWPGRSRLPHYELSWGLLAPGEGQQGCSGARWLPSISMHGWSSSFVCQRVQMGRSNARGILRACTGVRRPHVCPHYNPECSQQAPPSPRAPVWPLAPPELLVREEPAQDVPDLGSGSPSVPPLPRGSGAWPPPGQCITCPIGWGPCSPGLGPPLPSCLPWGQARGREGGGGREPPHLKRAGVWHPTAIRTPGRVCASP